MTDSRRSADKPLVVLTHGKRGEFGALESDERAWVEMQEELSRYLPTANTSLWRIAVTALP